MRKGEVFVGVTPEQMYYYTRPEVAIPVRRATSFKVTKVSVEPRKTIGKSTDRNSRASQIKKLKEELGM